MGNDIAVNVERGSRLPEPFGPVRGQGMHWAERPRVAGRLHARHAASDRCASTGKVVLAAVLAGGARPRSSSRLMTTPLYRAGSCWKSIRRQVQALDNDKGRRRPRPTLTCGISSPPRSACCKSQSLGERVAQDLNLAANPNFVAQTGDAASRLKAARAKVAGGINGHHARGRPADRISPLPRTIRSWPR